LPVQALRFLGEDCEILPQWNHAISPNLMVTHAARRARKVAHHLRRQLRIQQAKAATTPAPVAAHDDSAAARDTAVLADTRS